MVSDLYIYIIYIYIFHAHRVSETSSNLYIASESPLKGHKTFAACPGAQPPLVRRLMVTGTEDETKAVGATEDLLKRVEAMTWFGILAREIGV